MRRLMKCAMICGVIGSCVLMRAAEPTTAPSTLHTITLPQIDAQLPPGAGRNVVEIRCAVCHTPHYILNQPPFSRKVWTAEVAKMKTVFGAPIPDQDAAKIVDYLVAVRGTKAD